jgi:ubiquitin-protein ligase
MKKSENTKKETFISENNKKRLIKDIVDIMKTPLTEHGIFYTHDQNNMFKGYAVLIGPKETPYSNGVYCFDFNFPTNYPYSPPKLTYLTNDGTTRFNPNLYRNGKVCLSILNTWKGEQWTACQTIRSVLLTLITILHNKPLLNEPGIRESNKSFKKYNRIIEYMNFKTSIIKILRNKTGFYGKQNMCNENKVEIEKFICKSMEKNKTDILKKCEDLLKENPKEKEVYCPMYNMSANINYETLLANLNTLFKNPITMK